ncbi:diguanylate cyclase domain-containing protein [Halomonas sp. LS-001]
MVAPQKPFSDLSPFQSLAPPPTKKPKWQRRYLSWLSLSLMSFLALMVVIVYETRWVNPEVQAYFSQTGNLTGQQLATRARNYLQNTQLELLAESDVHESITADASIMLSLNLAYGLFDVSIYQNEYACTKESLDHIDSLAQTIIAQEISALDAARQLYLPIQCLTEIEMSQLDRRGEAINRFSENARFNSQLVTYTSLVIFLLGIVFWWMHERQLRRAEKATIETLAWIQRALHDPLTGVGNRSALNEDIALLDGLSLGFILIDVDFFKQYNDALGHPRGDALLLELCELIRSSFAVDARLYRLGGDEFAALIPCRNTADLEQHCQRLMEKLKQAALPHPAHPHHDVVTLSVGATCFHAGQCMYSEVYVTADDVLYEVKSTGRDGFRIAG